MVKVENDLNIYYAVGKQILKDKKTNLQQFW